MRNPHAGQPFTASDEEIAKALLDVSVPTLMLSLVHMSGNPDLIRGELKPAGLFLNEVQGYMSEEDKATARKIALEVIAGYRDRGCPEPEPIGPELLQEMMQWLVCEPVPPEYVPMLLEEMELDGRDARAVWGTPADDFSVVVIGCGESGLLAGIRLKEAGIPFTIVEKNAGVGGTWWQNTYPGARVDVGNHFYCYSFEPTDQWTHFFAEQPELQAYFQTVMDKYDIGGHVLWETEVTEASWDDASATWTVRARDSSGATTELSARAVISAVGQLNRPHLPDIDGLRDFAGPAFHSSEWDHAVDLRGKRVAMIGAGASGFQIAPAIAGDVDRLTVFQRTAQWMFPNPNYHEQVGPGVQWALRHLPFYGRWYRFLLFWPGCDKGLDAARVDADYPDQQKAVSEINEITRMMFTEWISSQAVIATEVRPRIYARAGEDKHERKRLLGLAKAGRWREDPWLSRHCRDAFASKRPRPRRSGRIVADNCSYDTWRDEQGRVWLAVMTPTRGQRLRLNLGPLPEELIPTSTIEINADGGGGWQVIAAYPAARVCSTRPQAPNLTRIDGIDAGVSEVFTDTSGRRYGAGQYERIAKRAERDRARGKARNKLHAVRDRHLARAAAATDAGDAATARAAAAKARRIERHNLGRKKLSAQRGHDRAATKDAVYHAVHDLVDTTAHIVAEDLSGLRGKSKFGRTASRIYSAWQRSFLADALASVPSCRGSAVTLINPAYTSQQVHPCGHLGIRRGKNVHCQTAGCPQQGIVYDTEINAARVIRDRATDPQISRYTPKHEVKRILIERAGTVENCPTTTQATTTGGGRERNNLPPKRTTTPKK